MWTPPTPSVPGWIWIPLSCWRSWTRAGEDTRPYKTQGTLRACVGAGLRPARGRPWCAAPTDYGPGALAEKSQARLWNRIGCNFCTPRARWPGLNGEKALRFCAPEALLDVSGVAPVNGGPGVSGPMGTKCPSAASPGDPLVSFPSLGKKLAPQGETLPPPGWRNTPAHNKPIPKLAPSSVTASPCHLPPRGKAF